MNKALITSFTIFLYLCALFVVILSRWVKGCENYLAIASKENGFFESIGALLLLAIFFIGINWVYQNRLKCKKIILIGVGLFSLIAFLASMEEISWGQHLFGFESGEFFKEHNFQKETNLHNFIDANLFSSIIYFSVYSFYVFLPIFGRFIAEKIVKIRPYLIYFPPLHVTLIVLFASSFQAYFYDDFGAWSDTITLISGMILFAIYAFKKSDRSIFIHFAFILLSIIIFMFSYKVFNFFNMQYEIRETFVVLATFIYFLYLLFIFKNSNPL